MQLINNRTNCKFQQYVFCVQNQICINYFNPYAGKLLRKLTEKCPLCLRRKYTESALTLIIFDRRASRRWSFTRRVRHAADHLHAVCGMPLFIYMQSAACRWSFTRRVRHAADHLHAECGMPLIIYTQSAACRWSFTRRVRHAADHLHAECGMPLIIYTQSAPCL